MGNKMKLPSKISPFFVNLLSIAYFMSSSTLQFIFLLFKAIHNATIPHLVDRELYFKFFFLLKKTY
jgi:hypothetical protein